MTDIGKVGPFEQHVLAALQSMGRTYGVPIVQRLSKNLGRDVSVGALYTTLDRLEGKGFVRSSRGEPTPQRGGRAKRYFELTGLGATALAAAREDARALLGANLAPQGA